MILIKVLNVDEDSILFECFSVKTQERLINSHAVEALVYKFIKPHPGTENDRFIKQYLGNLITDDGQEVSYFVIKKQDEGSDYLIKTDTFNNVFELL